MRVRVLYDSFVHGPEVLAALAEPDAPHSAEKLHVFAAVADRHDLALIQPLHSGSAFFVEYSLTLAVLDFLEQEMYFLSCANSEFRSLPVCLQPSGLLMKSLKRRLG